MHVPPRQFEAMSMSPRGSIDITAADLLAHLVYRGNLYNILKFQFMVKYTKLRSVHEPSLMSNSVISTSASVTPSELRVVIVGTIQKLEIESIAERVEFGVRADDPARRRCESE